MSLSNLKIHKTKALKNICIQEKFIPWLTHREHTILLSRKRVHKGTKRMNNLPLSPAVFSYATLQGKSLPTSPAEHCSAKTRI